MLSHSTKFISRIRRRRLPPTQYVILGAFVLTSSVRAEEVMTAVEPTPEHRLGDALPLGHDVKKKTDYSSGQLTESRSLASATSGFSINRMNRNAVVAGYHEHYATSVGYESIMNWTGDVNACVAGTVSSEFQDMTLRRINYYRAQTGLPADIFFTAAKNAACQEAALVMAYQNDLSHDPNKDFRRNPCLTTDAQNAASNGNLSLGSYGPGSIDRLILDDGSNNAAAGHRRWLLYPLAQEMGNGSIPANGTYPYTLPEHPSTDCVWVIGDFKASAPAQGIAWPNDGYVPWNLVPNDGENYPRWSYSYPGADFSSATVTVTQGGANVPVSLESVNNGFGDNTLVWRPSGISNSNPGGDLTYSVSVSGISGVSFSSVSYNVTLIDPFRVNDPPVISGSTSPTSGVANTYSFTATDQADSYELNISEISTGGWSEGAETSPTPEVIDNTDSSYDLLSSSNSSDGSRSFHLATPAFGSGDSFVIDRDIVATSGSQILFDYRRLFMHPDTKLRVELSTDGGSSFSTVSSIDGVSEGSSADWDPTFVSEAINVPIAFQNKNIRLRFRLEPTGSTFLGSGSNNGVYIDQVSVSNSSELIGSTQESIDGSASDFTFNPPSSGQTYRLSMRPVLGGQTLAFGPALDVTSSAVPAPVITSSSTADGAQGESFSYSIQANNSPTSYNATGLPAGAMVNTVTGEITGQLVPGTYTGITVSATNASGTGSASLTINILSGYQKFVEDNYPSLGADTADDDGDGDSNLLEAALAGRDPTVADAHLAPTPTVSGDTMTLSLSKSGLAGVDYTIEGSGQLTTGSWDTNNLTVITDDASTLTVSYPMHLSTHYFLRVLVTPNSDTTP